MKKETAFITGITGQDGSYLAEYLLEKNYNVIGLARRSTNPRHPNIEHLAGEISIEYGNLMEPGILDYIVAEYKPNEIYNLAAQSVPADSWKQPMTTGEITALGPVRVLEAMRKHKPDARFYQASSREIFGGVNQEVMNEETPFFANNPYGIAKLYAHLMTLTYQQSYNLFAASGILFNHESPRRSLHFVTRKVCAAVACIALGVENPPLNESGQPLVENGKLKLGSLDVGRDWGYAKDYVVAMWLMLQQESPESYVIASNNFYTIKDLCKIAFSHINREWEDYVVSDKKFIRPTEITQAKGDYSKAKKKLGWEPKTSFEDLIRLMVDEDISKLKSGKL